MTEKKIYTSSEDWWKDRKNSLKKDLESAATEASDPEIIKIMMELLDQTRIVHRMSDYFEELKEDA